MQAGLYILSQISYTTIDRTICVRESCTTTVDIIGGEIRKIIFPIFIILLLIKLGLLVYPALKQKIHILTWEISKGFIVTIGIIFIIFFSGVGIIRAMILNPESKISDFILPPLLIPYTTLSGSCPIGMIKEQWFVYENGQTIIVNCAFSYSCPVGKIAKPSCGFGRYFATCYLQCSDF